MSAFPAQLRLRLSDAGPSRCGPGPGRLVRLLGDFPATLRDPACLGQLGAGQDEWSDSTI
jgi:hypothetical protein